MCFLRNVSELTVVNGVGVHVRLPSIADHAERQKPFAVSKASSVDDSHCSENTHIVRDLNPVFFSAMLQSLVTSGRPKLY